MNTVNKNIQGAEGGQELTLGASVVTIMLCFLFGANAVAIKVSLAGMGVFTVAGLRFGIAAVTLIIWASVTGKPLKLKKGPGWQVLLLGLIFFTQLSLFYLGQNLTTASHGTLITNVLPFFVMLLAHFFLPNDRVSIKKLSGLILGFLGVALLFYDSISLSESALLGDAIVLAAVLVWSCNAIIVKKIISHYHPIQITIYPMLIATPLFIICGALFDQEMVRFINIEIVFALLYQTFVTASFGMVVWMMMVSRFGATALHSFVFVMPISGVALGVLILDEPITLNLIVSIIMVVLGLIVINRKKEQA